MRHHILFALSGLLAAVTASASHLTSSSSNDHSSSLLLKRTTNSGYSYCAKSSDKLVFKTNTNSCACVSTIPNNNSNWNKCTGPKTASLGKAVCGERGCNILCDDDDMVVRSGDCVCKDAYTLSGNKCIKSCGQYEAYNSNSRTCVCAPSCSRNSRNSNRCEPSCGDNEEYKNSSCQCKSGFEKKGNNNKCKPICNGDHEIVNGNSCACESGFKYNSNGKCKSICTGDNEIFNTRNGQCKCIEGFSRQGNNNKCKPICSGENEYYENGQCKCIQGCGRDNNDNKCKPICRGQYEIVGNNNKCKCKEGFEYDNKGVCKPKTPSCPNFMEWNGFKCICKPGCSPHGNNACTPPQCRTHEEYNQTLKKCVCKPNYHRTLFDFCVPSIPTCPKRNEFWNGTKCVCKPGCRRNRDDDDCEPNTPSHKPVADIVKKKATRQVPVWSSKFHTREQDSDFCPDSLSACPIPSLEGGYECVDTTQELENCGGCAVNGDGMDCTAIDGVSGVGCLSGQCVVFSCAEGYRLSSAGACVASLLGRS